MYKFKYDGATAELWFDDLDEHEIAYLIGDRAEDEHVCGMAIEIDYDDEYNALPDDGRWCLFCFNVTDIERLEAIAQEEWCYYEADVMEAQA